MSDAQRSPHHYVIPGQFVVLYDDDDDMIQGPDFGLDALTPEVAQASSRIPMVYQESFDDQDQDSQDIWPEGVYYDTDPFYPHHLIQFYKGIPLIDLSSE